MSTPNITTEAERFVSPSSIPDTAAIILSGGKSSRMGTAKALLSFGDEVLLQRVARIVGEVIDSIVVVAAPGQSLPPLPHIRRIVFDESPELGPLEGLRVGLTAVSEFASTAFVTSCDVPFLRSALIRSLYSQFPSEAEIIVPVDDTFTHPLTAIYRISVLPAIETLIKERRMRPFFLLERCRTVRLPVENLREADPDLSSFINMNTPLDYEQALLRCGIQTRENKS